MTGTIEIDGQRDYFLTTDDVAVGGTDIPHAPGNTFHDFLDDISHLHLHQSGLLCHQAELGEGKGLQMG